MAKGRGDFTDILIRKRIVGQDQLMALGLDMIVGQDLGRVVLANDRGLGRASNGRDDPASEQMRELDASEADAA